MNQRTELIFIQKRVKLKAETVLLQKGGKVMKFSEVKERSLFIIHKPDETTPIFYKNQDGEIVRVFRDLRTKNCHDQIALDQEVQVINFFKSPKTSKK